MARFSDGGKFWLVERGEAQWLAWRAWLTKEFRRSFFPDKLPVPAEWPPTTTQGAQAVVAYFLDIQQQIMRDSEKEREKGKKWHHGFAKLPDLPQPWIRWSSEECEGRVQAFQREENAQHVPNERHANLLRDLARRLRSGALPAHKRNSVGVE